MRLGSFEYLEPRTLDEACSMLAEHGTTAGVLAGGTDLLVRMKQGVARPEVLVDIKGVEGLGEVRQAGAEVSIGAAVPLTDLHRSPVIREQFPLLAKAALGVGAAQLQNMGTVGGNLCLEPRCWYYQQGTAWREGRPPCLKLGGSVCYMAKAGTRCHALYSGDTAAALLALDVRVRLVRAGGERTMPLDRFFLDDGMKHTVLEPGELLAEVIVPQQPAGQRGDYLKYRKRGAIDFPIVGVGAVLALDGGVCTGVRVGVTGAGSAPFVVHAAPGLALGKEMTPELIDEVAEAARAQARPVSNMEVSAPYRRRLVQVLVADALDGLASACREVGA